MWNMKMKLVKVISVQTIMEDKSDKEIFHLLYDQARVKTEYSICIKKNN